MKNAFKIFNISSWHVSYSHFVCLVSMYIVIVFNGLFLYNTFIAATQPGHINWLFITSIPLLLFSLTILVLSWLSLVTFVKPVLLFSVLLCSLLFYSTLNYGVIFDKSMLQNIVETNSGEAFSYLNFQLVIFVVLLGILPTYLFSKFIIIGSFRVRLKSFVKLNLFALLCCALIAATFYKEYASVGRNNRQLTSYITPFAFYTAGYKYLRDNYFYPPLPFKVLDNLPALENKTTTSLTVMVVGETARAANFSLQGYSRATNAYTSKLGVKYFSDVSSCGTATAISVPCMFSRLNRKEYDSRLANSQENVLDIIQRSGVEVAWIDNNSSCKGVCARVKSENIEPNKKHSLCDGDYCFDEILVSKLKDRIAKSNVKHKLIILHMIGSHGPTYYRRYPEHASLYKPDCDRSDIQNCTTTELTNTYDNTIAYTDRVLSELIKVLQESNEMEKSLLYVSDHGESLGEKGLYLHGFPYALAPTEQTHIPMIFWSNKLTDSEFNRCVEMQHSKTFSHDNIFDTLLGLTHVNSNQYQPIYDIFNACKAEAYNEGIPNAV
ncbi:phosphoethanolamine--lipid A transferase [Pseudoalteromonas sp. A3]|uniref:phosphoethanolamine transferase n=1 Tax=Pseudoalteromonas sp. A3 TaxID=142792 RepID=UPI00221F8918|nr:phosphoethanolamine--lipid A transferase [Pseudoalteromonas sp. A3]MCW1717905.1 phosphoethanolamine--lipid A transferase [Pseudoalteromonas sp. A3]